MSFGSTIQNRARVLLEALLDYDPDMHEERFQEILKASLKKTRSRQGYDQSQKLTFRVYSLSNGTGRRVEASVYSLAKLPGLFGKEELSEAHVKGKKEKDGAIPCLEQFEIIENDTVRGKTERTLTLKYRDKKEILDRFEQKCQEWNAQNQAQSSQDHWAQVRKFVPPEFDLLDQTFFRKRRGGETRILKLPSVSKNWSLITQGSYIDRDQQGEVLEQAEELAKYSGISLLLIRGQPGAGKTALMQWLAYELSGQNRIVLQKKREDPYWLEPLGEFSEQINQHFYLIADDLFRDDSILEELDRNELQFPLTLIGTTRFNEDQHDKLRLRGYRIEYLDLELSPSPESQEKQRILDRICQQDAEANARLEKMAAAQREKLMAAPSMLVLMLQLSEGKPFDLIVADVIKRLPSEKDYPVYQVFGVICSFYQFGITTPPEVVALCLPECSKKAVRDVVDFATDAELKGLVNTKNKFGYEWLATIHELIAQTAMTVKYPRSRGENLPYSPNSLKDYLRAAIPALDATKETHKRWVQNGLRLLAVNGEASLVRQVLDDYSNEIQSLHPGNRVRGWFTWVNIYKAVGLLAERARCLNAILSSEPQSLWEWTYWLSLIEKRGTNQQKQEAIAQTSSWLQLHPDDSHVRTKYLALMGKFGTQEQKQNAIAQTSSWLQLHPNDSHVRTKYLALIEQFGANEQKQNAIAQTSSWLQLHPDDSHVRTKYLALIEQFGTKEQKQEAITQTVSWLEYYQEDYCVRAKYLVLIQNCGTPEQKQEVIAQTATWLQRHPEDACVRTKYLLLIGQCGKAQQKQEAIHQTTIWLQYNQKDYSVRTQYLELVQSCGTSQQKQEALIQATIWLRKHPSNLSVRIHCQKLVDKCDTDIIRYLVNYNLEKYPGDTTLLCSILYFLRDYLDYQSCRYLCNSIITNFDFNNLSYKNYKNLIYIANFFREYGDFDAAANLYFRVIKNPEAQAIKSSPNRQQLITLAFLNYALLLLLRQPPDPYTAIDYLEPILAENPKHCVAHWYMARCYQSQGYNYSSKGRKIYQQATEHFQKAIEFDQGIKGEKTGRFWYEFGCFYRDAMQNPTEARTCFENSLNQKSNLPACVDLAELEVANGNIERARELLQQGLALVPITRPEREQRDKLDPRIQAIQSKLDL